jgi:hypothetical protein
MTNLWRWPVTAEIFITIETLDCWWVNLFGLNGLWLQLQYRCNAWCASRQNTYTQGVRRMDLCPFRPKQRCRLAVAVSTDPTGVTSRTVNLHSRVACSSCRIQPEYIDVVPLFLKWKLKFRSKSLCWLGAGPSGKIGFEKCMNICCVGHCTERRVIPWL